MKPSARYLVALSLVVTNLLVLGTSTAVAAEPPSLDALLQQVRAGYNTQKGDLAAREKVFRQEKANQAKLLSAARKELSELENKATNLEKTFQANEIKLAQQEEKLKERLGTMGELFGVVRQVAGDTAEQVRSSLVSAEKPGRVKRLRSLAASTSLPSIPEIEHLWASVMEEMAESIKVTKFSAKVVDADGKVQDKQVVRVGGFNVVSDEGYLQFLPEVGQLSVLARQPPDRYVSSAKALMAASDGTVRFSLDPSRGAILGLLVEAPTLGERLEMGGLVGKIILGLGAFALLIGLLRFADLLLTGAKIQRQLRSAQVQLNNPLGRVLEVYERNRGVDPEELERKLDEVIIRESGQVERYIWIVKVVAGVAPLLGLLGTVTGMIRTFQAITLYGTGDPKLMAGGISEALVTTMLGLFVAIPLVLTFAVLTNSAQRIIGIIEEQAAGRVARRAEIDVEAT